jgi:hypothetical protein
MTSCVTKFAIVDYDTKYENVEVRYSTSHYGQTKQIIPLTGKSIDVKAKGFFLAPKRENVNFYFSKVGFEESNQRSLLVFYNSYSKAESNSTTLAINDLKKAEYYHAFAIISTPPGADVLVNGKIIGKTPIKDYVYKYFHVDEPSDTLIMKLNLTGYKSYEETIPIEDRRFRNINQAKNNSYEKSIELIPEKYFLSFTIESTPLDAQVYLDKELIGKTPLNNWVYEFGSEDEYKTRTITLKHEDFIDDGESIKLLPSYFKREDALKNPNKINIELKPKSYYYAYKVLSTPSGASVSLGTTNEFIGNTPTEIQIGATKDKKQVNLEFVVQSIGYEVKNQKFSILIDDLKTNKTLASQNPKQTMVFLEPTAPLNPPNSNPSSVLNITSDPSNIPIEIGGKFVGQTPLRYEINWSEYPEAVSIVARKSGYRDATKSIRNGDSSPVNFVLQKEE